jgi:CheY-like chemotaxis protein
MRAAANGGGFDHEGFTPTGPPAPDAREFLVLNDAPVGEGDNPDLLESSQMARGLADLILASRTAAPFTLAVDADWGMGKSSLLRGLSTTLAAEPAVSTVWFNAWTSGSASALEGLIKSVLAGLDRNVVRRAVRALSRRTALIGLVRATLLVIASFFGLRHVLDEIWRAFALDAASRNQIKGVLSDALAAWVRHGGSGPDRRLLVVFIDDLDRCAGERIIEICEAIKLYLDVPGVVFVLACDQSVLWRAVRDSVGVAEPEGALEYLEKIIQISYRIPAPSTALALRLVDGYVRQSRTDRLFDDSMKSVIIQRSGRNPRRIKRLINSFVLEYHLNRAWDEIGVENLVKLIMVQQFYPGFYRILVDPRGDDPIRDFLTYQEVRSAVRQGATTDPDKVRDLFVRKGIRPPTGELTEERLRELENELPVEFSTLVADRDFVALLRSFAGPVNSDQLRRLLRKPLSPGLDDAYDRLRDPESDSFRGARVLWLDDRPETNRILAEYLRSRGAQVVQVTDRTGALEALAIGRPTVLLSDFTRHGDVNAGIDDLEYLRTRELYDGPVIFASGQGTPDRQRRAEELGALGPTNDRGELIHLLSLIVEGNIDVALRGVR